MHPVSPASACSFSDVSSTPSGTDSAYPAGYIATCAAEGITLGKTPYTFHPYDNITRAQLITMVARAAELGDPPAGYRPCFSNFSDQHYPWAARAAYAGWLDDFRGMGPDFNFWAPPLAARSACCLPPFSATDPTTRPGPPRGGPGLCASSDDASAQFGTNLTASATT